MYDDHDETIIRARRPNGYWWRGRKGQNIECFSLLTLLYPPPMRARRATEQEQPNRAWNRNELNRAERESHRQREGETSIASAFSVLPSLVLSGSMLRLQRRRGASAGAHSVRAPCAAGPKESAPNRTNPPPSWLLPATPRSTNLGAEPGAPCWPAYTIVASPRPASSASLAARRHHACSHFAPRAKPT